MTPIIRIVLLAAVMLPVCLIAQDKKETGDDTALIIVDVQEFYFPGGKMELIDPEAVCENIQRVLYRFRQDKKHIIHVKHNFEPGGSIHESVTPLPGEKVISKDFANSFRGTDLKAYLDQNGIKKLVICGMQTHMCVEAVTRAAADMGYENTVISDGCATRTLTFEETVVPAEHVHASTLASLKGSYAKIMTADQFLSSVE